MKADEFLTTKELAARWDMSAGWLAHWRVQEKGPEWIKKGWMVLYPLKAVQAYEKDRPHLLRKRF